jgi:hypothetical protein
MRAFPRQAVLDGTLRVYLRELADVPAAALDEAVRSLIRTSEFFPTVRAIREAVAERSLQIPHEAAALEQVHARIAWGREDEAARVGDPPPIHPLVRDALDHVGGFAAFRGASEPGVLRGQFLRLYRELRADAVRNAQLGDLAALAPGEQQRTLSP